MKIPTVANSYKMYKINADNIHEPLSVLSALILEIKKILTKTLRRF